MVCNYRHWVFGSGEIVSPLLQSLDDSEELPIVDVVILFGRGEGGRMIGTRMEVSVGVLLHEYSPGGGEGGIRHDKEGFGGVRHLDHGGRQEHFLEFNECVILLLSPLEGNPLFC